MAVFSHIKNFIKSSYPGSQKFEAATRIVQEEKKAKDTMPRFPGLEEYKVTAKLGDGAFSKVYGATKLDTNEKVAIKVVIKSEINNHQKSSVLKEAKIMKTIDHPAIIKLLDFKETKEHLFLILELCEGGELFHQIVRLTYLSEDLARHCIRQVAEGIMYLHDEKGIVHRDIKPENLLFMPLDFMKRDLPLPPNPFDEPKEDEGKFVEGLGGGGIGQVKIADFGLSKEIWDQQTRTPCGTVGYTAPEIVNDRRYSVSVDMWAMGCVLYTMLCGFPPFYDESIGVLTEKVAKGRFTFLSPWWDNISQEAKDLITNLLCVDPKKRYTIDQFLEHPWMKKQNVKQVETNDVPAADSHPGFLLESIPKAEPSSMLSDLAARQKETEAEAYKRMILERNRDEEELEAAAPSSGVSSVVNSRVNSRAPSIIASGATTPRRDLFSGVTSMKEMFDISYTVHRMAEEKARRKHMSLQEGRDLTFKHVVSALSEENEGTTTDEELTDENSSIKTSASEGKPMDAKQIELLEKKLRAISDSNGTKKARAAKARQLGVSIELNLEKSAILERRKKPQNHA
ncbi:kinase-like domain-containing protein [Sporodiniella umbellata]|nr:kinase-like domain-containing protein [Sporodiniella umbellata]